MTQIVGLLNCPFCGSPPAEPYFAEEFNGSGGGGGEVYCSKCLCSIPGPYVPWIGSDADRESSVNDAIRLWNTRKE